MSAVNPQTGCVTKPSWGLDQMPPIQILLSLLQPSFNHPSTILQSSFNHPSIIVQPSDHPLTRSRRFLQILDVFKEVGRKSPWTCEIHPIVTTILVGTCHKSSSHSQTGSKILRGMARVGGRQCTPYQDMGDYADLPYMAQLSICNGQILFASSGDDSGWHGSAKIDEYNTVVLKFDYKGCPAGGKLRKHAIMVQTSPGTLSGRDTQGRKITMMLMDRYSKSGQGDNAYWIPMLD